MLKNYYIITKPGILYGNLISIIAGFFLASSNPIQLGLLVITIFGLTCVIASGCVLNNIFDRDIDAKMERTKNRTLVKGLIPVSSAFAYACILGVLGVLILFFFTNVATTVAALIGLFFYVVVYTLLLKRTSIHSALIGGVSGAIPPVVGYLAVRGSVDIGVVVLFFILVLWQMPHSFAIALYRMSDYKLANIPVLPLVRGVYVTKIQIALYSIAFVFVTLLLYVYGYTGILYVVLMSSLGVIFIAQAVKGVIDKKVDNHVWAKSIFSFSIIILLVWCFAIVLERLLA
jgi:heme o synthase